MLILGQQPKNEERRGFIKIFLVFLKLGCLSFGGPIAHLGYFREEFVHRQKWLSDAAYIDLVALCQFIPGPASSQVGIALGLSQGGVRGAVAAWLGFTLPSALLMIAFGLMLIDGGIQDNAAWLHGLKVVAVAVVAQALWGMSISLCPDKIRVSLAVFACVGTSILPSAFGQIVMIIMGGIFGLLLLTPQKGLPESELQVQLGTISAFSFLVLFLFLLIIPPLFAFYIPSYILDLFNAFYSTGALVFGGGHVVLPLLQAKVVATSWVDNSLFLAGYGMAQAVPGPMFSFAAFLGTVSAYAPNGILGGCIALMAIFLPSFLLLFAVLPLWQRLRTHPSMQKAVLGINAAVVGLLLSAFYQPVWVSAIFSVHDYLLAMTALVLLQFWRLQPWIVVPFCALAAGLGWH